MVPVIPTPLTIRIPAAATLTGLPKHVMQKAFMRPDRRPCGIPEPPPHFRLGRAIHIYVDKLPLWLESLGRPGAVPAGPRPKKKMGAPTKAMRIAKREAAAHVER
jgi:hypothetical protein